MLRSLLVTLFAAVVLVGCGDEKASRVVHNFMPDNNLWMEDNVNFTSNVSEEMFNTIIDIAKKLYEPTAKEWNEELVINKKWKDGTVNADAWRDGEGATEINMYGGMARRQEVIPIGFALVLCHELNHLYGGKPYIDTYAKMAAEGQSDYMGAGWCLKNIAEQLDDPSKVDVTPYMTNACSGNEICLRQLAGGNSLGILLAKLSAEKAPNFETPDKTVVTRTNTSYPRTTQCRLDSYHNGTLGKNRPLCWYKP